MNGILRNGLSVHLSAPQIEPIPILRQRADRDSTALSRVARETLSLISHIHARRILAFASTLAFVFAALALSRNAEAQLAPPTTTPPLATTPTTGTPFEKQGMWIWYIDRSEGGSLPAIIARAHKAHIGTVYVKSGDGEHLWSQFTTSMIGTLHQAGLKVCGWQFVYGDAPVSEAKVGAGAITRGADCLVIDAEGQYEGKYASASRYINELRARIGPTVPVSLAAFPYVDYHPAFPYSVFLAPGAADANQPQMYWRAIGTTVSNVFSHTYLYNGIYDRPIYPIGQTYDSPGLKALRQFRRFAISYGGTQVSWWSWQETSPREFNQLRVPVKRVPGFVPAVEHPFLKKGSTGDMVVWAQEHLVAAGYTNLPVTGVFGRKTQAAVKGFQATYGLKADGALGTQTWIALLTIDPIVTDWSLPARSARRVAGPSVPLSASEPALRDEIEQDLKR